MPRHFRLTEQHRQLRRLSNADVFKTLSVRRHQDIFTFRNQGAF